MVMTKTLGSWKRVLAAGLSLGLVAFSPGLAPYEAAAANFAAAAKVNAPAAVSVPGMGFLSLGAPGNAAGGASLSMPSLQGALSDIGAPRLTIPAALTTAGIQAAPGVSAAGALKAAAAAPGAEAAKTRTAQVRAGRSIQSALKAVVGRIAKTQAERKSAGIGASKAVLDSQFDGGLTASHADPVQGPAASTLSRNTLRRAAAGSSRAETAPSIETKTVPGAEVAGREVKAEPKSKLSRAIRIGAMTAILMLAVDMLVMAGATSMGYAFAPSYEMPALANPEAFSMLGEFLAPIAAKVQSFLTAAWVAPFNEEVYFRAGVMGFAGYGAMKSMRWVSRTLEKISPKMKKLRSWVVPAAFGVAATEAAMFFALLHEVSDPILITVRITQALLFSYLYVREGLVSGLAHHAVFNGLAIITLPLISAAGGAFVAGPAYMIGAALTAAFLLLWKLTRPSAKKEAAELKSGKLIPYRLDAKGSGRLAIAGWITTAALAGLAALQPAAGGVLMMGALAAQMAPAALALGAYGYLLRNLEKREGPEAVRKIRNPDSLLPMGNKAGAWVGGLFGAMYAGIIAGSQLLGLSIGLIPTLGMTGSALAVAAVPAAVMLGIMAYRWFARAKGINPWVYVAQYFFGAMAAIVASVPWLAPAIEKLAMSAEGMGAAMIMPALSSMLWTIPVFIAASILMAVIGKAVIKKLSRP